jgi:toxin FitB
MYLFDTNVLSEGRKVPSGRANPSVKKWLATIDASHAFLSAMSIFETERGILLIERRDPLQGAGLRRWLNDIVVPGFEGRILPMTTDVARRCARLHVPDPQSDRDSWIAATALVHNLTIATRNVADFETSGVALINPWTALAS